MLHISVVICLDFTIFVWLFTAESGGSVLVYKGRTPDADEMFTAKAMANDGLSVKITPEGKVEFSTGINPKGNPVYADGLVDGFTYE